MPPVSRLGDIGSNHNSYPPTPVIGASTNTSVNSRGAARQGDPLMGHSAPKQPYHGRNIASGSYNTFVNSRRLAHIGTPINCGGVMITGSFNTIVN